MDPRKYTSRRSILSKLPKSNVVSLRYNHGTRFRSLVFLYQFKYPLQETTNWPDLNLIKCNLMMKYTEIVQFHIFLG